jgi:hypothetical protein
MKVLGFMLVHEDEDGVIAADWSEDIYPDRDYAEAELTVALKHDSRAWRIVAVVELDEVP